jgi:predicted lipoprotein
MIPLNSPRGPGRRTVVRLAVAALAISAIAASCKLNAPNEVLSSKKKDGGGIVIDGDAGTKPTIADCAMSRYQKFQTAAETLKTKTAAFAADRSEANRTAAQDAWKEAIAAWQEAELFRFGPAARSGDPGAQDLRDQIYGWPPTNRCKIDEQTVSKAYSQGTFSTSLVSARGLGAIEYLLFYSGSDNGCGSTSTINANGTWAALNADDRSKQKADYAAAAAADVAARASALNSAWDPAGGNFRGQFTTAGNGSTTFPKDQDALNAASNALFYLDYEVKDFKVAKPIGLYDCTNTLCPEALESQWAKVSTSHVRANLHAFRLLLEGCGEGYEGLGFDDWLWATDRGDLATYMVNATADAQALADAMDPPLEQAITTDKSKVEALYNAIKKITDVMKTEFITVLNLDLPKTSEGDND